jgi:hypothetical protein
MTRRHAFTVAAVLALAAIVGLTALGRTVQLGTASSHASDALVAAKARQLSAFERSLHRQLAAAPHLPAAASATHRRARRVVFVRPAPIVVDTHRAHEEDEDEEHEAAGDDD